MQLCRVSFSGLVLFTLIALNYIHASIEAPLEGGKTKRVFGRQQNHVEKLSFASAFIKEESKKVNEDEESEEDNENNDEDHQVHVEDQADYHSNVVSLPQKPTGLSYYASTTWYVLKNIVFIDFIWAYVIPFYCLVFIFSNNPSELLTMEVAKRTMSTLICSSFAFNAGRFILGEIEALLLSHLGSFGRFFLYENGSTIQSTRFLGIDLVTVTWMIALVIIEVTPEEYFNKARDKLNELSGTYKWLANISATVDYYLKFFYLSVYPFDQDPQQLESKIQRYFFYVSISFLLHLCMKKYLGSLLILGSGCYYIYSLYQDGKLVTNDLKAPISVFILSVAWFLTLSLSNGSLIRSYPIEYYPPQVFSTSFGTFLKDLVVYIIRDIGVSVILCYVGLMFAYKKLEQDYYKPMLFSADAAFDTSFPSIEKMWKIHLPCLIGFKIFVTLVQKFISFILRRHFPFPLDSFGVFSINWRLFGLIDLSVITYYGALITEVFEISVFSFDLKSFKPKNTDDQWELRHTINIFSTLDIDGNIKKDKKINTVQLFFIWVIFYDILYSSLNFYPAFILLSLLPKYLGALSMLGLLACHLYLAKLASLMPAACKGYLVPVYANYIIASICMAMNYEIQVDPAMIQFTKSVSEREGEDQNETTEIDTETTETATDNSESEKNTDENLEEPLQEEEQGKLEKSSEPLIDENLQKPPSDVDDQSGKNFKNSGKGARRRSSMFKSRRSSKKSDAFTGSSVTAVLAATALLLF